MQKNIVYGSITAGGDVHIGDSYYVTERDFSHSVLFIRIEKARQGYEAMLFVKADDDKSIQLFRESVLLSISEDLFGQVEDFQNLRRGNDGYLLKSGFDTQLPEEQENVLIENLYQTFFSGDIGTVCHDFLDLLQTNKIRDLLLVISTEDEHIQGLPWEIVLSRLTHGGGYDLPKNSFGLIRSQVDNLQRFNLQGLTVEAAPLKMLFIPALPENLPERSKLLEIEDEQRKIIEAVRGLEATGDQQPRLVMEILDCANLEEIQEALQKRSHDIVHISGHGAYVDAIKAGILYLENEEGDEQPTTGHQLGTILRQFSSIKLLVLSACETAVGGSEGSTAEQMAAVGLPAVLAMRFSVTDNGARLFTETLYTRLAYGDTLTKAMHDARLALWKDVQKRRADAPQLLTSAEWFTPVLYQNQAIGSLLKPGQYNSDTLNRFYPTTTFLAGTHTKFIGEGFIGRKRLLIQLRHCFRQGEHVCLHGLGGLGKTTTAEAFADLYRKRSGHDILIFRTGTEIQEAVILERIFERWKYTTHPDEFRQQQLKAWLDDPRKSSTDKLQLLLDNCLKGRNIILIFDNFEDLQTDDGGKLQQVIISKSLQTFIRYLLENAPQGCHILFTSRYKIADLTDLVTHLAVDKMTYAEQYRYINYSKTLRKLSLQERKVLDHRIDGHPRALQFLEGILRHTRTFDLTQFEITVGNVESKIFENLLLDRLYSLLGELERNVFATASVFFSRSPLMALCTVLEKSADELTPIMVSLSNWGLCSWESNEQLFEVHALTRMWMRQQKFPDLERYKAISHLIGMFFYGKPTVENGFAAKAYFEQAKSFEHYVGVAFRLEDYFNRVGLLNLSRDLALEVFAKNLSLEINTDALNRLGVNALNADNYDLALEYLNQSLGISRQNNDQKSELTSLNNIGQIYIAQGKYDLALEYLEKCLGISRQSGNLESESAALTSISQICETQGNYELALNYLGKSLNICRQNGDIENEGRIYSNIGQIYKFKSNYNQAIEYYTKSLSISQQVGDRRSEGAQLNNLGQVNVAQGNNMQALNFFERSLHINQQINDISGESTVLNNISQLFYSEGKEDLALKHLMRSLSICQQIGDKKGEGTLLNNIGQLYQGQGKLNQALGFYIESLNICQEIGHILGEAEALNNIGVVHFEKNNSQEALENFDKSLKINQHLVNLDGIATSMSYIGMTYFKKVQDIGKAVPILVEAYNLYRKIGSPSFDLPESFIISIIEQIGEEEFNKILYTRQNNT